MDFEEEREMSVNVSPVQIMNLWEQLMSCLYGGNSYGSTVAEIYLYTVMPFDPFVAMERGSQQATEAYAEANQSLYELCRLFEKRNCVELWMFDGPGQTALPLDTLVSYPGNPYRHRVHIGIEQKDRL